MLAKLQLLSFFGVLASCLALVGLFFESISILLVAERYGSEALYAVPFIGTFHPSTAWTVVVSLMAADFLCGIFCAMNFHPIQGVESKLPDSEIPSAGITQNVEATQAMTPASPPLNKEEQKPVKIRSI